MFNKKTYLFIILVIMLGAFFRIYHIDFGLPHSLYADEPEIGELAVKYTYEIRNIIANGTYYELIPISFVYGTFPTYVFTVATMIYSKTNNLLGVEFDKQSIYIFLRTLNALLTLAIIPAGGALYYKLFKSKFGTLLTIALLSLNWKLIVHAHYLNMDIVMTLCLLLSFITALYYYESTEDTKFTVLTGVLFGLAVGTKVTALITFPLFLLLYLKKRDFKGLVAVSLIVYGTFIATNPFSVAFFDRFLYRVYTLGVKENGPVFDSVDSDPLKYVYALFLIATPAIATLAAFGISYLIKNYKTRLNILHVFLFGQIALYMLFYSTGMRRVDRWLLPILPLILVYAAFAIELLKKHTKPLIFSSIALITLVGYMYFPLLLLTQFQRHTPKSEAYLWARDNLPAAANKYAVTEEGLDPLNKLPSTTVKHYQVYSNEGAHFNFPDDPAGYDYIILSSRPMTNFKRPEVIEAFPFYVERWKTFEKTILDPEKFELVKSFERTKPNLIPLSDVFIYKNLNPIRPLEELS